MQVVILAAGMGKRLKYKTKNHTKSMVSILGKTFLEHSLDNITKFDISKIIIVVGFCGDEIKQSIGNKYNGVEIVYIDNPVYKTTNNIYSLSLAKEYLETEDTILIESDIIYEESIIKKLIENPQPNIAVVDKYKPWMDGTVVKINDKNQIIAFIPKEHFDYKEVDTYFKTVNIYKLSKEFLKQQYLPFLSAYCTAIGHNSYYENVLRVLLTLEQNNLTAMPLNEEKWYEVDDLQDYSNAELLFCKDPDEKLNLYQKRFGGYWRFDGLKDFCYLVNPYFPTQKMIAEMQNNFTDLLQDYPSGQSVQQNLISNIFDLEEDEVLVGNGAAELINAMMTNITDKVGIISPTFQEYPNRLKSEQIVELTPNNPDFKYTVNDLKVFADKIDTLLLINPDNPSGNFITKDDVLSLIEFYKSKNKRIILDESFVDFSNETDENSLLHSHILQQYQNLAIIKSISKSYGVPGIRLGILATVNKEFFASVKKNISIWNINSYAEFFLQIFNKYKSSYKSACKKIVENRSEFFAELAKIKFIRPIHSQANYILCEVLKPWTANALAKELLQKNIFIKTCSGKNGFEGKEYIRLAIKSKNDNMEIIKYLKTFG